jgi:N-acetylglutamate synthase-like GNAT family acetyltransferase
MADHHHVRCAPPPSAPPRVRIRAAQPDDADAVARLLADLAQARSDIRHAHTPPLAAALRAHLDGGRAIVADAGAHLVGIVAWRPAGPARAAAALAVADGWRQGDVGARLLARLGDEAARDGVAVLVAEVTPVNAALRAAARALGLPERRTGTRVEILLGATVDPARP